MLIFIAQFCRQHLYVVYFIQHTCTVVVVVVVVVVAVVAVAAVAVITTNLACRKLQGQVTRLHVIM